MDNFGNRNTEKCRHTPNSNSQFQTPNSKYDHPYISQQSLTSTTIQVTIKDTTDAMITEAKGFRHSRRRPPSLERHRISYSPAANFNPMFPTTTPSS
jgi:hypothetical protein